MSFYDDFDYDLLNKDNNLQEGGASYKFETSSKPFTNINDMNLTLPKYTFFLDKVDTWDKNELYKNLVAEHIIDKKLDNHDDKYNYTEQNNINLLLSNSMILDTTNSVNTTLQVNEVKPISDKDINQKFWKGEQMSYLKSVNTVYKEDDLIVSANVYCVKQKGKQNHKKSTTKGSEEKLLETIKSPDKGISNYNEIKDKKSPWVLWLEIVYVDSEKISNEVFNRKMTSYLNDIFNKHNKFIIENSNTLINNFNDDLIKDVTGKELKITKKFKLPINEELYKNIYKHYIDYCKSRVNKFNVHLGINDGEMLKIEEEENDKKEDEDINKANLKKKLDTLEEKFQNVYDEYSNKYNKYVDKIKKINKTRQKVIEHCQENLVENNFGKRCEKKLKSSLILIRTLI